MKYEIGVESLRWPQGDASWTAHLRLQRRSPNFDLCFVVAMMSTLAALKVGKPGKADTSPPAPTSGCAAYVGSP